MVSIVVQLWAGSRRRLDNGFLFEENSDLASLPFEEHLLIDCLDFVFSHASMSNHERRGGERVRTRFSLAARGENH
jgi:hypothetical protein